MKKLLILFVIVLVPSFLYAQSSYSPEASVALPFAAIPHSASGMVFGSACITNPAQASLNPAKLSVAASWQSWAPKSSRTDFINASASMKIGNSLSFSGEFSHGTGEEYDIIGSSGNVSGTYAPKDLSASLGVGYALNAHLAIGAGLVFVSERLSEDDSYSCVAFNASTVYSKDALSLTLGVNCLGGSVKDAAGQKYPVPGSVYASGAYIVPISENITVQPLVGASYYLTGGFCGSAGVEAKLFNYAALRVGYNYASRLSPVPSYLALGASAMLGSFSLNLAWIGASDALGGSLLAGLGYSF